MFGILMKNFKRFLLFSFCFNILFFHHGFAQSKQLTPLPDDDEMSELLELLEVLEEETTIATKTKINSDFVPGMVTVLKGNDMQALGKHTVWEALSLVPGIKTIKTSVGAPMLIVRGVSFPINSGNVKVMLNSTTLSSEVSGLNSTVLLMPISQVERIEFIRGPSSSLYGNSAYMGLVNIVTYKENKQVSIYNGDGKLSNAGGSYYYDDPDQELHVSANVALQVDAELNSPVQISSSEKNTSVILGIDYKKTQFVAQLFKYQAQRQNKHGITAKDKELAASISLKQNFQLFDKLAGDLKMSYQDNQFDQVKIYEGSVATVGMDFSWDAYQNHQVLFGFSYDYNQLDKITLCNIRPQQSGVNQFKPFGCPPNIIGDGFLRDKNWYSVDFSFLDQYQVNPDLTLVAGIGANHNGLTDEFTVSPRLAFVWQVHEHHIIKGQYTRGFRSPAYFELFNFNQEIQSVNAENANSFELGYIFKRTNIISRITLFYTHLEDVIYPNFITLPDGSRIKKIDNNSKIYSRGIELEWEQKLNDIFKWNFNISYTDSKDNRGHIDSYTPVIGASQWVGNLSLYIQPKENMLITGNLYHVGSQNTGSATIEGYNSLDLTLNLFGFIHPDINLRLGIKNVLDDDIYYVHNRPVGVDIQPFPGRTWWAQLSYDY